MYLQAAGRSGVQRFANWQDQTYPSRVGKKFNPLYFLPWSTDDHESGGNRLVSGLQEKMLKSAPPAQDAASNSQDARSEF
jgi:hypothetical protein